MTPPTAHRFTGVAPSVALLPPYPGVCAPGHCQQTASNKASQRHTLHRVTSKPSAC